MSKNTNKAAKAATPVQKDAVAVTFKTPEEYKKVSYTKWPEALKEEYKAYRAALKEKAEAELSAKWDQLFEMLKGDDEALALAKEIRNPSKPKKNPVKDLFGSDSPEIGSAVPFEMGKMKLVEKCQAKGWVLDIKDNKICVVQAPAEEAAA